MVGEPQPETSLPLLAPTAPNLRPPTAGGAWKLETGSLQTHHTFQAKLAADVSVRGHVGVCEGLQGGV